MKDVIQSIVMGSVLFGVLVCSGFAKTAGTANGNAQNLRDCLDRFATCDRSRLTTIQASEIADLQHDENLWGCLTGYGGCDHSALTAKESKEVADAEHRRNLLACETTVGVCVSSLLTPSETEKVAQIEKEQNQLSKSKRGL